MKNLNINGLATITATTGTRKEIYETIATFNPTAIIDFSKAFVIINDEKYLIILKKVGKEYKVNIIWRLTDNTQFQF